MQVSELCLYVYNVTFFLKRQQSVYGFCLIIFMIPVRQKRGRREHSHFYFPREVIFRDRVSDVVAV